MKMMIKMTMMMKIMIFKNMMKMNENYDDDILITMVMMTMLIMMNDFDDEGNDV